MKKLLLLTALIAAAPTAANAYCLPAVAVGSAAPIGLTAIGTTFLPLALFATIALNTPFPVCEINGVQCAHTYPQQHDVQRVEITQPAAPKVASGKSYHVTSQYGTDSIRSDGF